MRNSNTIVTDTNPNPNAKYSGLHPATVKYMEKLLNIPYQVKTYGGKCKPPVETFGITPKADKPTKVKQEALGNATLLPNRFDDWAYATEAPVSPSNIKITKGNGHSKIVVVNGEGKVCSFPKFESFPMLEYIQFWENAIEALDAQYIQFWEDVFANTKKEQAQPVKGKAERNKEWRDSIRKEKLATVRANRWRAYHSAMAAEKRSNTYDGCVLIDYVDDKASKAWSKVLERNEDNSLEPAAEFKHLFDGLELISMTKVTGKPFKEIAEGQRWALRHSLKPSRCVVICNNTSSYTQSIVKAWSERVSDVHLIVVEDYWQKDVIRNENNEIIAHTKAKHVQNVVCTYDSTDLNPEFNRADKITPHHDSGSVFALVDSDARKTASIWAPALGYSFSAPLYRHNETLKGASDDAFKRAGSAELGDGASKPTTSTVKFQSAFRAVASDTEVNAFNEYLEGLFALVEDISEFLEPGWQICPCCHKPVHIDHQDINLSDIEIAWEIQHLEEDEFPTDLTYDKFCTSCDARFPHALLTSKGMGAESYFADRGSHNSGSAESGHTAFVRTTASYNGGSLDD